MMQLAKLAHTVRPQDSNLDAACHRPQPGPGEAVRDTATSNKRFIWYRSSNMSRLNFDGCYSFPFAVRDASLRVATDQWERVPATRSRPKFSEYFATKEAPLNPITNHSASCETTPVSIT